MPSRFSSQRFLELQHSPIIRYLRSRPFLRDLLLILLTLSAMGSAANYPLVNMDDPLYVGGNVNVLSSISLETLAWDFETFHASNWHPLTWLSLQLDTELWGCNSEVYHRTNLVFHLASVILLAEILHRMTGRFGASAAVAALFAVHPLHVESVAWVSERKDVLSTLLGLLALAAYVRYARRPSVGRMALVCLAHAASLLAKPMLVTLPLLLLLLDYWPLRRFRGAGASDAATPFAPVSRWRLVLEKTPLFLLSLGSSVMAVLSQHHSGALKSVVAFPLGLRCANALNSVVSYLGQTFWPANLAAFYPYPRQGLPWEQTLAEAILLLILSGVALRAARERAYLLVGWLWYLFSLLPVIGLVQVGRQAQADRYTYVPLIGIFLALVWGIGDLLGPRRKVLGGILLTGILAVCVGMTRKQVGYWADSLTLWEHTLAVTHDNAFASMAYAQALFTRGRKEEAIDWYRTALRCNPQQDHAWMLLGQAYESQRRWDDALECYQRAAAIDPTKESYRGSVQRVQANRNDRASP